MMQQEQDHTRSHDPEQTTCSRSISKVGSSTATIQDWSSRVRRRKILDILTNVALNDSDETVKDLAFAAIHNLAVHDTAEMMAD
jgi:hypothetical protein